MGGSDERPGAQGGWASLAVAAEGRGFDARAVAARLREALVGAGVVKVPPPPPPPHPTTTPPHPNPPAERSRESESEGDPHIMICNSIVYDI
jgi:hypothetical protein